MAIRTKRRAKFDFHGRRFVWWIDGDRWLRIASADKTFVVAYPLGTYDEIPLLVVHGQEFPGLPSSPRPRCLVIPSPDTGKAIGAWVNEILEWSFDSGHELITHEGLPRLI